MDTMRYNWPPRILFNTDGCLAFKYLFRRNPGDVTEMIDQLAGTGVDVLTVLVGINDDLSWRGSPHGELWGECWGADIREVLPAGDDGRPVPGVMPSGDEIRPSDLLQMNLQAMVDDGHDVFGLYLERARAAGMGVYAAFRMNDAHSNMEHRMADGRRSALKIRRPDLLIGSPPPSTPVYDYSEQFSFTWQWDYAQEEVRARFLGLFDEVLTRYGVDGLELDFCRAAPFFKPHQGHRQIETMTGFMRRTRELADEHAGRLGQTVKVACRVPSSFDAVLGQGLDVERWIDEGLVDIATISSTGGWRSQNDVPRAVAAAGASGTLIYVGSGGTYRASPLNGYEVGQPAVRRAIAHNAYAAGAAGVHLFNHDYANHRAMPVAVGDESAMPARDYPPVYQGRMGPFATDRFTRGDLQVIRQLADGQALRSLDRCYQVSPRGAIGDYEPQLPRKLSLTGRGAGDGHLLHLTIEDDIEAGIADGRICKTELRLRLTEYESNLPRIRCEVNDQRIDLYSAAKLRNSEGNEWLVVDNPPLRQGDNAVLVVLEGAEGPNEWVLKMPAVNDGWPSLEQCELVVRCERMEDE